MEDTFSFYEQKEQAGAVTVVNVPIELGSDARGLAETPKYLSEHGLSRMFATLGREVAHTVTISCPKPAMVAGAGTMKNVREVVSVAKRAKLAVQRAAKRNETVIALGGDHSAAIGTIAGAAASYPSLGLIYIDAHPDCTTETTTLSGNVHGMVVSAAMGKGNEALTELFTRTIAPENILHIGLKDFDAAEIAFMREHGMRAFTMLDISRHGLSPAFSEIDTLLRRVGKVWVSMDLDSIDEEYAPGVAMSTPGGLTKREVLSLAHFVGASGKIAGMDIVEIQPSKDVEGKTAGLALELIARFLGQEYSWYKEYMQQYRDINVTSEAETVRVRRGQK